MTIHMNITQSHYLRSMLSLYLRQSDVALCSWSGGQRRRQNLGEEVEWREAKEEMPPYRLPLKTFWWVACRPAGAGARYGTCRAHSLCWATSSYMSSSQWSPQCSNRIMAVIYTILILSLHTILVLHESFSRWFGNTSRTMQLTRLSFQILQYFVFLIHLLKTERGGLICLHCGLSLLARLPQ